MSSSAVVAVTVESATESYALSLEPSTTLTVIVVSWSPSSTTSLTPVTVTYWDVDQFDDVNVNVAGDTVASPVSADVTVNTTSDVGGPSSTTVNSSAVGPASDTDTVAFDTDTPAGSAAARLPDESNFETNTSVPPVEVRLTVPAPGSKSTVPLKDPVV